MDFFETSAKRYSHKEGFLPDAVPVADLERIAKAGLEAPCGNNRQSVRLVIVTDRTVLDPLCEASPTTGLKTAPAAIAVLIDGTVPSVLKGVNFDKEDYSAAVENMLLGAVALGYASVWLDSPYWDAEKQKKAKAALGAPDPCHLWAVLPIGKPDGEGSRREKLSFSERVSYNRFGGTL